MTGGKAKRQRCLICMSLLTHCVQMTCSGCEALHILSKNGNQELKVHCFRKALYLACWAKRCVFGALIGCFPKIKKVSDSRMYMNNLKGLNPNYFYQTVGIDLYLSIYVQHVKNLPPQKILTLDLFSRARRNRNTFPAEPREGAAILLGSASRHKTSRGGERDLCSPRFRSGASATWHFLSSQQHTRRQRWLCAE